MKPITHTFLIAAIAMVTTGCIRKEPLNAECDIIAATLPGDVMSQNAAIRNSEVTLFVKKGTDKSALAPEFILTEGATIDPPSGTVRNFDVPQRYTVTAEDKIWQKTYTVWVNEPGITLSYDFEHVRQQQSSRYSYDIFYEIGPDGNESFSWASGNAGYAMTGQGSSDPASFPTYQSDNGIDGKCAAMTTRITGLFGNLRNSPLAAGSLFIGEFKVNLSNTLLSTRFGRPFDRKPLRLSGYYRYTPGEMYYRLNESLSNKLEAVPGKIDEFNIYGVMFERTADVEYLNGTNVQTSPNVVALARYNDGERIPTETWRTFSLPFVYLKEIDMEKLENGQYSISIVMSSSIDGDLFSGAPGSTLMVDQVVLTCEE